MAIFVFSPKKPMGIAAYMNEELTNVVLVGGLINMILLLGRLARSFIS